ncbi:hypothetical protein [Nostoc sp. DedQUE04]|uniref:hypothetical protein n=1 Tax=Nostoc sp. DedQUE04 TaxID=3075390 RepID=UPI002AD4FA8F|nr:hypothetical protein [Nostoc sp. DedQUE04]
MSYASKACLYSLKIVLLITLVSISLPALSENKQLNNDELQILQTEISDRIKWRILIMLMLNTNARDRFW